VVKACRRLRWIDGHSANGIVIFSMLHRAIVDLYIHFGLYRFAPGEGA
jgi:hypothetical protein